MVPSIRLTGYISINAMVSVSNPGIGNFHGIALIVGCFMQNFQPIQVINKIIGYFLLIIGVSLRGMGGVVLILWSWVQPPGSIFLWTIFDCCVFPVGLSQNLGNKGNNGLLS